MSIKCDNCTHKVLSDERDVGVGWVYFCNKWHWSDESEYDEDEEYCTYRDNCTDYERRK